MEMGVAMRCVVVRPREHVAIDASGIHDVGDSRFAELYEVPVHGGSIEFGGPKSQHQL